MYHIVIRVVGEGINLSSIESLEQLNKKIEYYEEHSIKYTILKDVTLQEAEESFADEKSGRIHRTRRMREMR